MGRLLALVAALCAGALLAWASLRPPSPAPASAPATAFSAERALPDVRAVARRPHPLGSPANRQVRDYLVGRMTALGLSPQVRAGPAVRTRDRGHGLIVFGGQAENIVGVLPGRDRRQPAVALMAHYDSVPGSPGGPDDGAGVAAALEAVRAIAARGTPARDVMVVLTDGEEAGLLGAQAFFGHDPLARRIGLVLNMEARGGGGPAQMFETSPEAGGLVRLFRRVAPRPTASSLMADVYRRMPNDTDFTLAKAAGVQGLNFAFIGRQFEYHSPTATADRLDPGSLQDMGRQVLAVAAAAAFAPALPARAPDRVYSQVFGDLVLAYPPSAGWALLALAAGLIALAVRRARRQAPFLAWDVARGAGGLLAMALTAAAVLHLARRAVGVPQGFLEQQPLLAHASAWELALLLTGVGVLLTAAGELARGRRRFALLPAVAALAAQAGEGFDLTALALGGAATLAALLAFGRPAGRPAAWTGVLLAGLVLGVAAQALAPAAAYAVAWPLLLAAAAAALTGLSAWRPRPALLVLAPAGALAVGWLGGMAHLMIKALDAPEALAAPLLLAGLVLWPLVQPAEGAPPERLIGPALLAAGILAVAGLRLHHPYDARYPQAVIVRYEVDQTERRAWRISAAPEPSAWARAVLTADGGAPARRRDPLSGDPVLAAPARYLEAPRPQISLRRAADGRLTLRVAAPPGARTLDLRLRPSAVLQLETVAGQPARGAVGATHWTRVHWEAAEPAVELTFRGPALGRLDLRYAIGFDAWPAAAIPLPPMPAGLMAFGTSGGLRLSGRDSFAW